MYCKSCIFLKRRRGFLTLVVFALISALNAPTAVAGEKPAETAICRRTIAPGRSGNFAEDHCSAHEDQVSVASEGMILVESRLRKTRGTR